ncbi:hypothetical protein [Corynebacterium propinquum]|uniref:hypothetical protein n=1 Tax=Corynebacterium propinquum TaxID=43769 RepID=UPI001EF21D8F|nr:hypothetical protein [Corynebacterium propinquum]
MQKFIVAGIKSAELGWLIAHMQPPPRKIKLALAFRGGDQRVQVAGFAAGDFRGAAALVHPLLQQLLAFWLEQRLIIRQFHGWL